MTVVVIQDCHSFYHLHKKIVSNIPFSRLIPYTDKITGDHQHQFRFNKSDKKNLSLILHFWYWREKQKCNGKLNQLFIDIKKSGV
jgi:hypothetical protein